MRQKREGRGGKRRKGVEGRKERRKGRGRHHPNTSARSSAQLV